jgi:valyl-tRNA synthetase
MKKKMELSTRYDSSGIEEELYQRWEESGFFKPGVSDKDKPYTIMMPPPNVTGVLHIGHAFNITYQDIIIRWRRMMGYKTLWVPGSDHAGIATQNVVERKLKKEGITRQELGREKFIERVWEWKKEHGGTISRQLRRLGSSCDWSRERFTMDEGLSRAVRECFVHLYRKGLIYKGKYIINWCPRCSTAISDEEVEHKEHQGKLYYIRYPVKNEETVVKVATTRPETMLGDTGVAINPGDKRYRKLKGKTVILPIIGREMAVIEDDFVDMEMGTGVVKVTPGHDPNDFEMGQRHSLPLVNILNPDGTLNENAGPYAGMDCLTARKKILEQLEKEALLEKVESHVHQVGHCYRCDTVVEPFVSTQWFVKMKPLAEPALDAVKKGEIRFHPKRWTKIYTQWMENIRDWCISRQIWWGHRIPVWYCEECDGLTVEIENPTECAHCRSQSIIQDNDVLDTWFSSWLWPFSTLGWPDRIKDLDEFYPTDTLVTAHDIIFFWVARMIMSGLEFMGGIPFSDVYIHGMIKDDTGKKMSKSLENAIDPLDVMEEFGADALRFSIINITSEGQDVFLSTEKFHIGRNLTNKIWNAVRLLIMNLGDDFDPAEEPSWSDSPQLADRWILSRYQSTVGSVTQALEGFRFNEASSILYDFFWHDYCDAYVELAKDRWASGDSGENGDVDGEVARYIAWYVLEGILRLFHPFMPFITEKLWLEISREGETLMKAKWPDVREDMLDKGSEKKMEYLREVISHCLMLKGEYGVTSRQMAEGHFLEADKEKQEILEAYAPYITRLSGISPVLVHTSFKPPQQVARAVLGTTQIFIPLKELVDTDKETARLEKEIERIRGQLDNLEKRLNNKDFLSKAPEDVVNRERSKQKDFKETLSKLERNLRALQEGD